MQIRFVQRNLKPEAYFHHAFVKQPGSLVGRSDASESGNLSSSPGGVENFYYLFLLCHVKTHIIGIQNIHHFASVCLLCILTSKCMLAHAFAWLKMILYASSCWYIPLTYIRVLSGNLLVEIHHICLFHMGIR